MLCSLKYISLFIIGFLVGHFTHNPKEIHLEPATEVYKEVSHVFNSKYENAELIYSDPLNDVNYYRVDNPIHPVKEGDIVKSKDGVELPVTQTDIRGFYVDMSALDTVAGMSGEPIFYNGEIIGYISSVYNLEILYCIWSS